MNAHQPTDESNEPSSENLGKQQQDLDVAEKVDQQQLKHFVSTVKTAEQQVGENIIQALQHAGTVAVLTTVAVGQDGQQCVVSAALQPDLLEQVRSILAKAQLERVDEEPCVGFHCLVKPKSKL